MMANAHSDNIWLLSLPLRLSSGDSDQCYLYHYLIWLPDPQPVHYSNSGSLVWSGDEAIAQHQQSEQHI